MPLTFVLRIALRALRRNTLRTVLSMLGISIGVGAFICSVAVGFAGVVGILFGYYPARQATRLDPIEALRR